jgi:hypothetical protein
LTPLTCKPFPPAPLDISSLNLQCDQPYSSPDCTAPPRPQSPAGYPDADPFVSSGPSSLRTNDRSYVQPRTPPLTAIATLQHRRTTRSSRPASPRFNMPTRLPRLRMTPAIGHPSSGRMIRAPTRVSRGTGTHGRPSSTCNQLGARQQAGKGTATRGHISTGSKV